MNLKVRYKKENGSLTVYGIVPQDNKIYFLVYIRGEWTLIDSVDCVPVL